jgi:aryl-alcohol dehydrogenase-like predicted oxidoreductase
MKDGFQTVKCMKRRDFLKLSMLTACAFAFDPFPYYLYASDKRKYAHDVIALGSTDIQVSRLGIGTGTNGIKHASNQTRKLGVDGVADLLHAAFDEGVYFWDSADQYGTHLHMKEALKRIPREKVVILTKTHATTEKEMTADLNRFRKEIGTDYIDIVLLHCMEDANWPVKKKAGMEVLSKAKEDGIIRAHGVSCHTLGALEAAANSDWVQVDLVRINPSGVRMDADLPVVANVLRRMKSSGKAVIGMKILGAGKLTTHVDKCLEYVLAQNFIDCFTIGQENQNELYDLIERIPAASVRG